MSRPVNGDFSPAFLDRCYSCDNPASLEPFAVLEEPASVRCVYRCACGHVWYSTQNNTAYDKYADEVAA